MSLDPQQPHALLRLPAVLAIFPVSKTTWWNGVRAGRYLAAIKLGLRASAWKSSEIALLVSKGVSA